MDGPSHPGNGQRPAINQTAGGSLDVVQHIFFSLSRFTVQFFFFSPFLFLIGT